MDISIHSIQALVSRLMNVNQGRYYNKFLEILTRENYSPDNKKAKMTIIIFCKNKMSGKLTNLRYLVPLYFFTILLFNFGSGVIPELL